MELEEMVSLIKQVWSDAMSDDGMIWFRSNAKLEIAKSQYPELYKEAVEIARSQ